MLRLRLNTPARFLSIALLGFGACIASAEDVTRTGPGWRMIYNNDATNILNCVSSYNPDGDRNTDGLTDAKIRASVAEAAIAGMDAQLIQPGMGWVPWWESKIAPLAEQEAWFRERYGIEPTNAYHKYLLSGGDMIGVFVDECKKRGVAALTSFRLNDAHHLEYAYVTYAEGLRGAMVQSLAKFYVEHPEYRLNPDIRDAAGSTNNNVKLHNWLIPEVRQYKLDLITEMLGRYDLDGLELDFMRYQIYFPSASTDAERAERIAIMSDFIGKVRRILDATAKPGQHKWLGVQVPADGSEWNDVGFDPVEWRRQGIEWFNMKPSAARTSQQSALAALRAAVPDATIYYTLFQQSQVWNFTGISGYGNSCFRRTTKEMLETTARIAHARGADGISFFNFVYYRKHGSYSARTGPFNEPPYELLPNLINRDALEQPPAYFFLEVGGLLFVAREGASNRQREFSMDIVPRKGNAAAKLRLQVITNEEWVGDELTPPSNIDRGDWQVILNGTELTPAVAPIRTAYPFETPYAAGFGHPEQYLTWDVPAGLLKDGANNLFIKAIRHPEGLTSNGLRLKWVEIIQQPSPRITAIPAVVVAGGTVVITGDDLLTTKQVYFANVPATSFRVDSPTQITATAPAFLTSGGRVTIRAQDGLEASSADIFTVAIPPHSITRPSGANATAGQSGTVVFSASAQGLPAPSCQWQMLKPGGTWENVANDANHSGAATATLTVTNATAAMNGWQYRCVADNGYGQPAISAPATLAVATDAFPEPTGIVLDAAGNLYVADARRHTVRKISSDNKTITTLAGRADTSGTSDGAGGDARFNRPHGLKINPANGKLHVADTGNNTVRIVDASGTTSTLTAISAPPLNQPAAVAIDNAGNTYVADTGNHIIRMITASSGSAVTIAGNGQAGWADASGTFASFDSPRGIAVDADGWLYVADTGNHTIRTIAPGTREVATLAGAHGVEGSADGPASIARLRAPRALVVDGLLNSGAADGSLYIADTGNHIIRELCSGTLHTIAGHPGDDGEPPIAGVPGYRDGTGDAAWFNAPADIALDAGGDLYVADTGNAAIRKILLTSGGAAEVATLTLTSAAAIIPDGNDPSGDDGPEGGKGGGGGALSLYLYCIIGLLAALRLRGASRRPSI